MTSEMAKYPMTNEIDMANDESLAGLVRVLLNNLSQQKAHDFCYRHFGLRALSLFLFVILCSACSAQEDAIEFRFWTTTGGRKSDIKLKFVEKTETTVKLKRQDNGKVIEIRINQLSRADQQYVRDFEKTSRTTLSAGSGEQVASADSIDWSSFRGPRRAGTSTETGLPTEWNSTQNIVWKTPLPGYGTSSPITFGDHIYVTCYSGYGLSEQSPGDVTNLKRHLVCLDRGTGRVLWDAPSPSKNPVPAYKGFMALHGYASNTPAADKDGVYIFFGSSGAAMFSHEGQPQWEKSLGTRTSGWGSGSSPILYKNLVIIHAEVESSTIFALDKKTGREAWSQKYQSGNQHTRATPLLKKSDSGDELVFHSRMGWLSALDPASGRKLWEFEGMSNYQNPSPVTDGSLIFAVTFGKTVAVGSSGREVWKVNKGSEICTPIYYDGHLYWANEGGIAFCVEAKTGDLVYEKRLTPSPGKLYASGVLADGKIYYVSRENGTFVVDAKPVFRQQAHNKIESDSSVFNATPAISNRQLLLRSDKFLYCIGNK